ncbi:hypothetical protein BKA82DRAFT_4050047, partial [Pisolithus tinctorius]
QHTVITTGRVSVAGGAGLLALTTGHTVSCIDRPSNDVARTWNALDNGSLVMYSEIRATPDAVYAIGLANSNAAYLLHATSLFIDNGSIIASVNITANFEKHKVGFMSDTELAGSGRFIASNRSGQPMTANLGLRECINNRTQTVCASSFVSVLVPVLKATTIWQAIHQTFIPRLSEGTRQVTGYAFPFTTHRHGLIRHVTFSSHERY